MLQKASHSSYFSKIPFPILKKILSYEYSLATFFLLILFPFLVFSSQDGFLLFILTMNT